MLARTTDGPRTDDAEQMSQEIGGGEEEEEGKRKSLRSVLRWYKLVRSGEEIGNGKKGRRSPFWEQRARLFRPRPRPSIHRWKEYSDGERGRQGRESDSNDHATERPLRMHPELAAEGGRYEWNIITVVVAETVHHANVAMTPFSGVVPRDAPRGEVCKITIFTYLISPA